MTQDEIIEMARQAGMNIDVLIRCHNIELLESFVKLVAQQAKAEEREECANACEEAKTNDWEGSMVCAAVIRARGQT